MTFFYARTMNIIQTTNKRHIEYIHVSLGNSEMDSAKEIHVGHNYVGVSKCYVIRK